MGFVYPTDQQGVEGIRISIHMHNTFEEVELVLQSLREFFSGKAKL
jgi:selenocysteine lyase/cysteine desulfurase